MANSTTGYGFRPLKSRHGATFEMDRINVGAGGALKAGDVIIRSSGVAVLYVEGSGVIPIGVMAQDADASATDALFFPTDGILFRARCTTGTYVAATYDGGTYDILATTGAQGVDLGDTTNGIFKVLYMFVDGINVAGAGAEVVGRFVVSERDAVTGL